MPYNRDASSLIDRNGLKAAQSETWRNNSDDFVRCANMCFGFGPGASPPFWHFLETLRMAMEHQTAKCENQSNLTGAKCGLKKGHTGPHSVTLAWM